MTWGSFSSGAMGGEGWEEAGHDPMRLVRLRFEPERGWVLAGEEGITRGQT